MTKAELRKAYMHKRTALSHEEVEQQSAVIAAQFWAQFGDFEVLHTFIPILQNNEPDVSLIYDSANKSLDQKVYITKTMKGGELLHVSLDQHTVLKQNRLGILEPVALDKALNSPTFFKKHAHEKIVVLVPMLVFDTGGQRLGYGGGYYDRFLAHAGANCIKVGISLFSPINSIPETNSHDIPLDFCITPEKTWVL